MYRIFWEFVWESDIRIDMPAVQCSRCWAAATGIAKYPTNLSPSQKALAFNRYSLFRACTGSRFDPLPVFVGRVLV
jgi:hypothetical protein